MASSETILQGKVIGTLTAFDRLIFRGHLLTLFPPGAMERFMNRSGVLTKNFKAFVEEKSEAILSHAKAMAHRQGRPYEYLMEACTRASGDPKQEKAKEIAVRDGIQKGLICVFSTLEPCRSFHAVYSQKLGHPEIVSRRRKCLHLYFYFLDPEFGLMHLRLQTWFPFQVQVYVNGREWLSRLFDRHQIGYRRYENSFIELEDLARAQTLADELTHRRVAPVLDSLAKKVNPLLPQIAQAGFGSYYWCIDQAEIATDVMFQNRAALEELLSDFYDHALRAFGAKDVMRFLGKKLSPNFKGEVTTRNAERPEGRCVKHRAGRNTIKMYDKFSVLRIETTINNPQDFKVYRPVGDGSSWRWSPMGKGVANMYRYAEIGLGANRRYLDALNSIQPKGEAVHALDGLCRSHVHRGKRVSKFHPVTRQDCHLFEVILQGNHILKPFRNGDIDRLLHPAAPSSPQEARRRSSQVWRLLVKLRGHGLIARVPHTRAYRVTRRGYATMYAAIRYRNPDFPALFNSTPAPPHSRASQ